VKRQLKKFFERDAIIDLAFQLGIGSDTEPLLKKKAFKKHQRRIGIGTFVTEANVVVSHEDFFDFCPVDDLVQLEILSRVVYGGV
jgi:hypothetical protein